MDKLYVDDVKNYLASTKDKFHFSLSDLPYELRIIKNEWDNTGIAFDVELYKLWLNVMIPGAFGLFYGFSRTHHRVMLVLEEAGWIIHKAMFAWIYPNGNPQGAQNAQKRIDDNFARNYGGYCDCAKVSPVVYKQGHINHAFAEVSKDVIFCENCKRPIKQIISTIKHSESGGMKKLGGSGYGNGNVQEITQPLTIESEALQGYYYGLGFGKPVLEPIIVAQAPYNFNVSEACNVIQNGTGIIHKENKHPGNFLYMHNPECTQIQCADECLSNKLTYAYQNFYYNLAEDLDSHIIDVIKARFEKHEGLDYPNSHPSVKPIAVNEYIGKTFLPPSLYGPRKVFNPFSGSGSEIIGLKRSGWDEIVGVEISNEFAKISADRYKYYFNEEIDIINGN